MEKTPKRWLLSMLKTSGSKRKYLQNGSASEERHVKRDLPFDELPQLEPIKTTQKIGNGKINMGPLVRFLRNKVGENWDDVYSEIIARIPTALLDYREVIFWFVADKVEFIDGRIWNKETQKFLWAGEPYILRHWSEIKLNPELKEFYVHPITNELKHIPQRSFKKISVRQ
ncbi:MAG: hypothetical protein ACRYFX_29910 [Janthinobacterium lividum]